ncbi:MAG: class II fructose-bisphosphate aldolase [Armatimonadetes bacterium]|nr:class II fructose-bisphosphate aldolase [Armatimonadota bacterium]
MPLATGFDLLEPALEGGYAVGAFNANNLESVKAVIDACADKEAPVFLQVSQGAIKYAGLEEATALVSAAAAKVNIPVALHLDHGTSYEQNVQCLRAGFTSLMYDGSKEPFEENIRVSEEICRMAHACGLPVECELGLIPKIEDYLTEEQMAPCRSGEVECVLDLLSEDEVKKLYEHSTDPDMALEFKERTGCDSMAVAIGAIHGMTGRGSRLDFDLLQRLMDKVGLPFVLHAASGIPLDQMRKACQMGVCKVNVATRLSMALIEGTAERIAENPSQKDFRKVFDRGMEKIKEVVYEYIDLFGCAGKAGSGWTLGPDRTPKITKESPE